MNCNQAKEHFLDETKPGSKFETHVSGCAECAAELASFQSTMALMDEWKAPEPSAYFQTRLSARLAEARREEAMAPRDWLRKLWTPAFLRPALVGAMGLAFVIGMNFYQPAVPRKGNNTVTVAKGTAVGDLQALDKNEDVYADFDLLDDIGINHAQHGSSQSTGSQL